MKVDDAVRRRLQEKLASGGVSEREVALEVLWWLPREFVDDYERLFLAALNLGDQGKGSGAGMAGVRSVKSSDRGTKRGLAATGGGKKYKGGTWVVRDEVAMEVKTRVDRRLRGLVKGMTRIVRDEMKAMRVEGDEAVKLLREGGHGGGGGGESRGSNPMEVGGGVLVEKRMGGKGKERMRRCCRDCGRIAADEWARCPFPHA